MARQFHFMKIMQLVLTLQQSRYLMMIGENGQITISFPSEHTRTTGKLFFLIPIKCFYSSEWFKRNTAYSQFYIQQLPQTGTTRIAILRTNISFDYDAPGKTKRLLW